MENHDNEYLQQELPQQEPAQNQPVQQEPEQPVYQSNPYQQPYHGTGAGRKESPFANSPYVMNQRPDYEPYRPQGSYMPPQEPPRKPKKAKKSGGKVWKTILCTVLALAVVAGSCVTTALLVNEHWEEETEDMIASFERRMDQMQEQINAGSANQLPDIAYQDGFTMMHPGSVYEKNVKSVVLITSKISTSMFGQSTTGTSTGSGFVLTQDGYVVTNHHVVDKASAVSVTMHDGKEYPAKVIGSDATNDVALLKIEEEVTLQAVTVGSSDALKVGDQVIAIGNPLGELTSTLTVGYVSAKERNVTTDGTTINMIQTDAAINSGNSGGPLFNSQGQVVGITTAKYSGSSRSGATIEGIGFAIPIDDVMPLVDDLRNYGYINSAYLGVMVSDVDASTASYYGLPVGAYVQEVTPGYCAEKAGLHAKDIIVSLDQYKVKNVSELTRTLRKFKAGDTTTVTVFRSGRELELTITLDAKPHDTQTETEPAPGNGQMPQEGSYDDWYNYFAPFFGNKG